MEPIRASLARHDHHNIEIKTALDLSQDRLKGQLDLYVFVPKSMNLKVWGRADLMQDFRSRVRLALPEQEASDVKSLIERIETLRALIEEFERNPGQMLAEQVPTQQDGDPIFQWARRVGALFGEMCKYKSIQHKRELVEDVGFEEGRVNALDQVSALLHGVALASREMPILRLLDQYRHITYAEYLGSIRAELGRIDARRCQEWDPILQELQKREAKRGAEGRKTEDLLESDNRREAHLMQIGQLKKFFQSEMFVEVSRKEVIKKFSEPVAAGAAGFAALLAAAVERAQAPGWLNFGFQGMFFLSMGIFLYVLKDRLKDRGRAFVTERIRRYLPDVEQELVTERGTVGQVNEWLSIRKRKLVPQDVQASRTAACTSDAERHLPEDVLHYRRTYQLSETAFGRFGPQGAMQEVLRVNLDRYLKHMDDPYKMLRFLNERGEFSAMRTHKVYHFYACLKMSSGKHRSTTQTFRIVMDKNGVDRVESTSASRRPLSAEAPQSIQI